MQQIHKISPSPTGKSSQGHVKGRKIYKIRPAERQIVRHDADRRAPSHVALDLP